MGQKRKEREFGSHFVPQRMSPINDEWQTCKSSWECLIPYLETSELVLGKPLRECRVWMPFFYDGKCAEHLKQLGFINVYHEDEDFFVKVKDKRFTDTIDFIWDNPPYTGPEIKEKILKSMEALGKPFVLLFPSSVIHTQFIRDIPAISANVQCLVPRKVMVQKSNSSETESSVPFKGLLWLCWKMGLQKDIYLIE